MNRGFDMSLAYPRGRVSPAFFIPVSCTYLFFFVIVHSEKKKYSE